MNKNFYNISDYVESERPVTEGTEQLGFQYTRLGHGPSAGVDQVTLHCGSKKLVVLPTRGMGIWEAKNADVRFGWNSPIQGPVHPMFVPVAEPSGLGWLEGFDEMLTRCGLASNGAPDFHEQGNLLWPLHRRVANLPASNVSVEIDEAAGEITIRGTVNEFRFHIRKLQLKTEISMQLDSNEISIVDRVSNLSNRPGSFQMLYHCNFGAPVLEPGSRFVAPIKKLVPRDPHAASGIDQWDVYGPSDAKETEQVYFMELAADENDDSIALLTSPDESRGVSIGHNVSTLPCFTLWKNTVGWDDGYVTGLEPGTNFPNPRSFEESQSRAVELAPSASQTMQLKIGLLADSESVSEVKQKVESLKPSDPEVANSPTDNWCA